MTSRHACDAPTGASTVRPSTAAATGRGLIACPDTTEGAQPEWCWRSTISVAACWAFIREPRCQSESGLDVLSLRSPVDETRRAAARKSDDGIDDTFV